MAKRYPRKYVVVERGKCKEVEVKDPVHEAAVLLKHQEAMGLNEPDKFDTSQHLIKDD
jgi:hypothetical protein